MEGILDDSYYRQVYMNNNDDNEDDDDDEDIDDIHDAIPSDFDEFTDNMDEIQAIYNYGPNIGLKLIRCDNVGLF
jgi:hypothetical protein